MVESGLSLYQKNPLYLLQCTFAFKIPACHVLKLIPIYDKNQKRTNELFEVKNDFIVLESCWIGVTYIVYLNN